jgi:outer membrane protein assembly factor BamD
MFLTFVFFIFSSLSCQSVKLSDLGAEKSLARMETSSTKKQWTKVIEDAENFRVIFPYSPFLADVIFLEAQAYYSSRQYLEAALAYDEFCIKFPYREQSALARFQVAASYDRLTPPSHERDRQYAFVAIDHYNFFLQEHPNHSKAAEAEKRISVLSKNVVESMLFKARHYLKQKKYHSAILVFERVLSDYLPYVSQKNKKDVYEKLEISYSSLATLKASNNPDLIEENQLTALLSEEELILKAQNYREKAQKNSF